MLSAPGGSPTGGDEDRGAAAGQNLPIALVIDPAIEVVRAVPQMVPGGTPLIGGPLPPPAPRARRRGVPGLQVVPRFVF